jgi:signal transduction histidine kinase/CheY-like chemotaxis protein
MQHSNVETDIEEAPHSKQSTTTTTSGTYAEEEWRRMNIDISNEDGDEDDVHDKSTTTSGDSRGLLWFRKCQGRAEMHWIVVNMHVFKLLFSLALFTVLCSAGIAISSIYTKSFQDHKREDALDLAAETGAWFSQQLDRAILPLFSLAQFATELENFHDLPAKMGPAYAEGSLPFLPPLIPGGPNTHRNITGVCDEPSLVARFTKIASVIKANSKMEGILVNLQLAPQGVVCLLHPLNNTEDFENDVFMDNTGAQGLDVFTDPASRYIANSAITKDEISIAGPLSLRQCIDCDYTVERAIIARLPIYVSDNEIVVDGKAYKRWGFATALINWENLVAQSWIYENFREKGNEFQLTRTDRKFDPTNNTYFEQVVILAETDRFEERVQRKDQEKVTTALQTTNNEWEITVIYSDSSQERQKNWMISASVILSACLSCLAFMILVQKQVRAEMIGEARAQVAAVETERNVTSYFAHELRNPLGAIDSALAAMPDDLPEQVQDLVSGMQKCCDFMSSVMNNLLDVRKMEEGKMALHSEPLSLKQVLTDVHQMLYPAVKEGVAFDIVCHTNSPQGSGDWVLGDAHLLKQVLTNVITNAIKYTSQGSITLKLEWIDNNNEDQPQVLRFDCIDTGPGIPKKEQEKMFERFVQRGGAPGTGLGLAIAKHICQLMDGSIGFDSDPTIQPGTTCTVILPLTSCQEPSANFKMTPQPFLEPIQEPISFLIIDDVKINRLMLKKRFQKVVAPNCTLTEASTGEEALKILESMVKQEQRFDVIIVDQYMEDAGGVLIGTDVVVAMRRMKIDSLIIGSSGNDLATEFHQAGADLVWQKPIPSNPVIIQALRSKLSDAQVL